MRALLVVTLLLQQHQNLLSYYASFAFSTCKANWVYCANQLGINIAGISAPEAAIAGVTVGTGYKVLASSEESAKAF